MSVFRCADVPHGRLPNHYQYSLVARLIIPIISESIPYYNVAMNAGVGPAHTCMYEA